jgi:hypothetical protein
MNPPHKVTIQYKEYPHFCRYYLYHTKLEIVSKFQAELFLKVYFLPYKQYFWYHRLVDCHCRPDINV